MYFRKLELLYFVCALLCSGLQPCTSRFLFQDCDESVRRVAPKGYIHSVVKDYGNKHDKGYTFLASDRATVTLKCIANFPVEWVFDNQKAAGDTVKDPNVFNIRQFTSFQNTSSYEYHSYLVFFYVSAVRSQIFSCQAVSHPCVRRLFLSQPVENGRKTQVRWDERLNIRSTDANYDLKESNSTDHCSAYFYYGLQDVDWSFCCRASTADGAMGFIVTYGVKNVMALENMERKSPLQPSNCIIKVENITHACAPPHLGDGAPDPKTIKSLKGHAIKCELNTSDSSAKDPVIKAIFSIAQAREEAPQIYFSWKDINPEDMLRLELFSPTLEFRNSTLQVECLISLSYFTHGGFIAVQDSLQGLVVYKDDLIWANSLERYNGTYNSYRVTRDILVRNTTERLYCFAPVWNTSTWVNKSVELKVLEPKELRILNVDSELNVMWDIGERNKTLVCRVDGNPITYVKWMRKNRVKKVEEFKEVNLTRVESVLAFGEVDKSIEGNYKCQVSNYAEFVEAKIRLSVRDPKSFVQAVSASAGVALILLLLLAGLIVLWRKNIEQRKEIRLLTPRDIKDFTEGSPRLSDNDPLSILQQPYNTEFNETDLLGKGAFGTVYKGSLNVSTHLPQPILLPVAIKTVPKDADVIYLKALLSELKILAFISANCHPNVVRLMGASTKDLKNREVLVAIEFCSRGNLKSLLQKHRQKLDDNYQNINWSHQADIPESRNLRYQIVTWAVEIADGMSFLGNKNVIHGDLAARNILLNEKLESKITDFGLARVLAAPEYIKKSCSQCPLPWKWMAIESLEKMTFSVKSDVWAYGILLWELFSLAQTPYPGITWSTHFVECLKNGMRCNQPAFASSQIYEVMRDCWKQNPAERPSFEKLSQCFSDIQQDGRKTSVVSDSTEYLSFD